MGFPPEVWFEENLGSGGEVPARVHAGGVAGKVEHLFETLRNPKTGQPYTNADVVRMSTGVLTEEDVEGIRSGRIADPLTSQIAALAAAFSVPPSYFLDQSREPSVLGEEVLEALADEKASAILRESARLPQREREIVVGIVRQFGSQIDDA